MTRSRDVSAVQNNLGVAIPPAAAGKNAVINGGMDIWQRGTSFTIASSTFTYTADRWMIYRGATGCTVTRQTTSDTTNLPNIQYCMRVARDSGNTSTAEIKWAQSFENVNSIPFAGKTVTLSFYARAGANFSGSNMSVLLIAGTGTDQNAINGYTGQTTPISTTQTLTTTWTRYSFSATIGATMVEIAPYFAFTPSGTAGANDWIEITGVQLELGSSATPFSRAGGNIQGELAACQRYYVRYGGTSSYTFMNCSGNAYSGTAARLMFPNPVVMRTAPTSVDYSTLALYDGTTLTAVTGVLNPYAAPMAQFLDFTVSTGLTTYRTYTAQGNNSTSAYLALSAEL